jgi:molecular chaperone GrpE (heat shock protein)
MAKRKKKIKTMLEVIDSINKTLEAKKAKQQSNWENKIRKV